EKQVVEEQAIEEQAVEEQVIEEQVVEEQVIEERVIEERVVEEQVTEEQIPEERVVEKESEDADWDENKEGSLELAKKKQAELKTYYDEFPSIDDIIDETRFGIREAKEFTESILHDLPSGEISERTTACHILKSLLESRNTSCLFFDSTHGGNLHDASGHLAELNLEDRPFVLKLSSSEGLGDSMGQKTEHGTIRFVQALNKTIEQEQYHSVIEDILGRLSKAHGIEKQYICVKIVFAGTFSVVYTVNDLANYAVKSLSTVAQKLKDQFQQYLGAKIHPLLFRPAFDISFFDKQGNKTFTNPNQTHQVGPPEKTKTYISPDGWTRYGLKVLGKYQDGNAWLHPFRDPGNWYRAFHGTGRVKAVDFGNDNQSFEEQYAPVDAVASIFESGFRPARKIAHGNGVYCSPNPKFPENGYVATVELDTQKGKKKFKCMLQVAVNPDTVRFTMDKDIWVAPNPQDIRPYGVLIKEV
ncbi:unnamed protein product, partial [Rotaria sordida]